MGPGRAVTLPVQRAGSGRGRDAFPDPARGPRAGSGRGRDAFMPHSLSPAVLPAVMRPLMPAGGAAGPPAAEGFAPFSPPDAERIFGHEPEKPLRT